MRNSIGCRYHTAGLQRCLTILDDEPIFEPEDVALGELLLGATLVEGEQMVRIAAFGVFSDDFEKTQDLF